MDLEHVLIPTLIIKPGMIIKDVFEECALKQVHALPYMNEKGEICGRLTLKNIMKFSCLPQHMIELASLLGNQLSCVENAEAKAKEIICNPVEPYVLELNRSINSSEPLIKALAMMEKNDHSYIFIIDDNEYKGQVNIQGIARAMSQMNEQCE